MTSGCAMQAAWLVCKQYPQDGGTRGELHLKMVRGAILNMPCSCHWSMNLRQCTCNLTHQAPEALPATCLTTTMRSSSKQ